MKRYMIETLILVVAATLCAVVANAMAGRERKLALVGNYGSPARASTASTTPDWVATSESETTSSVEFAPLPDQLAEPVPTSSEDTPGPAAQQQSPPVSATAVPSATVSAPPAATRNPSTPAASPSAPAASAATRATRDQILARFPPTPDRQYVDISGADAAWLHAQGALFLDARRTSIYEQGHIAGAQSFSVWESDIDEKVGALMERTPDQKMPIVVYCSGGACEDSHMLSEKLWGLFFENVLVYKDGFPDWQGRGGATRTGARP